jgi:Domain of unknown function (DUF222)/HNH endonuclease
MRSIMEGTNPNPNPTDRLPVDAVALLEVLRDTPTDALVDTFEHLDSLHNASGAYRLMVVAVLDEREIGREDGARDANDWLNWSARVTQARARALVGTARALRDRPAIATAAMDGRFSSDQLDAVVLVATPETDAQWAEDGPGWTAHALRAKAKQQRTVPREEAVGRDARRSFTFRWNEKLGALRFSGELPDEAGARVHAELTRAAEAIGPDEAGQWAPFDQRCADVLIDRLGSAADEDTEAHRATCVLHAPEAVLAEDSDEPGAYIDAGDSGIPIANETARRLTCDGYVQRVIEDARGVPIRLGRRTRTVPTHLFRLLKHRDRHCRAPGCTSTRGLHAHHRKHWADGGTTDLDNLILLCGRHHRLLHENKWQIRGRLSDPEHVEFRRRNGEMITPHRPPPLDAQVRERLLFSTI